MIWSFVLAGVGVFGLWLAGRKNNVGWLVGLGAQFLWAAYALATHQYGFLLSCLGYGWVYGKNYLAWRVRKHKCPHPLGVVGRPEEACGCPVGEKCSCFLCVDPPPSGRFTQRAWNRWYNRQLEPVDD